VIDTNLKGSFLLSRAVVPLMKKHRYGKIIFVSSNAASVGLATIAPYSASKAGMIAMANSMVAELAQFNINVNSVSPGSTATPINQHLQNDPEFAKILAQRTPRGIAFMQPEEVAAAALFLASDEARAVHGLDLIVDNGIVATNMLF
jgi:NAD(P)-dependent dehydrogenase (short-subunit alcohol dehydrogenase family)